MALFCGSIDASTDLLLICFDSLCLDGLSLRVKSSQLAQLFRIVLDLLGLIKFINWFVERLEGMDARV